MVKIRNSLKHISLETLVPIVVFVLFLLLNIWTTGPAYLSDEIGYLDKAATIAGSTVHVSSSWYGGYALLVSPAFLISHNPMTEWHLILVLNALMWAGSAWLLLYILRETHPERSKRAILWASIGALLYPSWLSMSGYAFSTSGFVLIFMGSLAALIKSKLERYGWLCVSVFLAGYLSWTHPLGLIFTVLLAALLIARAFLRRIWGLAAIGLAGVIFAALYAEVIDPWFRRVMSGSAAADDHYAGILPTLHDMASWHFWVQSAEVLVGLLLFAVVATFGLGVYGALPVLRKAWDKPKQVVDDAGLATMLLVILAVVGTIGVTAFLWANTSQLRIDQWVYGRYTDMYLLPLIAFGLLASWRSRLGLWLAALALFGGIFLSLVTNPTNTSFVFDNKADIEAFWPMHIASILHFNYYWLWGALGGAGIAAVALMAKRKVFLTLLIIPVALVATSNMLYHHAILNSNAKVTSLYSYIHTNYTPADCIGFTNDADPNQRFELYSYYLHGYTVERLPLSKWLSMDCGGAYLTYSLPSLQADNLRVIGQETSTGLYVLSRSGGTVTQPLQFE